MISDEDFSYLPGKHNQLQKQLVKNLLALLQTQNDFTLETLPKRI